MKIFFILIYLFFLGILIMGCDKSNLAPNCDSTNTVFNQLYLATVSSSGFPDTELMDTEIHEYTFEVSSQKEICAIGYQSQPDISATPYKIEIVDESNGSILYSEDHIFSSSATSYVSLTAPVNIQSGTSYTIRRIQTDWAGNISNTIGRLIWAGNPGLAFPQTFGDLTITETCFYQNGGPSTNVGLPFIDMVFSD